MKNNKNYFCYYNYSKRTPPLSVTIISYPSVRTQYVTFGKLQLEI